VVDVADVADVVVVADVVWDDNIRFLKSGVLCIRGGRGRGCFVVGRLLSLRAVVCFVIQYEYRSLPVLGVRIRRPSGSVPVLVFFSSRPRMHVVNAYFVIIREGWLHFLCRVSFCIYVASDGML
jgi:hypothetical protein